MKKTILSIVAAALVLSSCTQRLTDFTVISTKNFPIGGGQPTNIAKADKRVKGKDMAHMILCIPTGQPNLKEAIDRAIESHPGAIGLADGVVKSKFLYFLLYGQSGYIVEGTPIYEVSGNDGQYSSASVSKTQLTTPQQGSSLLFFHEVKAGETLSDIAKAYGVTISDIVRWNELSSTNIQKGTKLKLQLK